MKKLFFLLIIIFSGLLSFSQNANYVKEKGTGYRGTVIKDLKAIKGLSFCVIEIGDVMEIIIKGLLQIN
ncbi:MAG: hypothetical protein M3Z92_13085 [Bacteroidota bacterium]|nr:hypothetical protein [Bacteroidota bacterium]